MTTPRRRLQEVIAEPELSNGCQDQIALQALAVAITGFTTAITPAITAISNMDTRWEGFCKWLKSYKSVVAGLIVVSIFQVAPDNAPVVIAALLKALGVG